MVKRVWRNMKLSYMPDCIVSKFSIYSMASNISHCFWFLIVWFWFYTSFYSKYVSKNVWRHCKHSNTCMLNHWRYRFCINIIRWYSNMHCRIQPKQVKLIIDYKHKERIGKLDVSSVEYFIFQSSIKTGLLNKLND